MYFFTFIIKLIDNLMRWFYPPQAPQTTATPEPAPIEHITVSVPPVPISAPTAPKATILTLALAIRDFEGKPGDQNYRLNNPGNARYSKEGYLPIYGNVKRSANNFAIFPTYELGWLYLQNLIKTKIRAHPRWTILDFVGDPVSGWAPASDNNPVENYAAFIAKRLGVSVDFKISGIV